MIALSSSHQWIAPRYALTDPGLSRSRRSGLIHSATREGRHSIKFSRWQQGLARLPLMWRLLRLKAYLYEERIWLLTGPDFPKLRALTQRVSVASSIEAKCIWLTRRFWPNRCATVLLLL